MKLIIDAWGSDGGPQEIAAGVLRALQSYDFHAVFVGPKAAAEPLLEAYPNRVELLEAQEYISNTEHPVFAIRKKKNSSLVLGLQRFNEEGDAFVSAGSTGALLAGGYFITKRLAGISRACLAVTIPNPKGGTVLVDTGANMDTTPEILHQFAVLGSAYVEAQRSIRPRVGLLNVGAEAEKGDRRSQETYQLLSESSLHFIGNVEARGLLAGDADVVVCDGFAGNVALKTIEGTASTFFHALKDGIYADMRGKLGGLLLKPVFRGIQEMYDYKAYGAAPLLGVRKPILKAHGNSSADTFALAIRDAVAYVQSGAAEHIRELVEGEFHESETN